MPVISQNEFETFLASQKTDIPPSLWLIFGEEFLCKSALDRIVQKFLPRGAKAFQYVPLEGDHNFFSALAEVNTFSLMPSPKVVALLESKIFYSSRSKKPLFEKARDAVADGKIKQAAVFFLKALALGGISLNDLSQMDLRKSLQLGDELYADGEWILRIVQYCVDHRLAVPEAGDLSAHLTAALQKGFPRGNHFIITTDVVDKKQPLYGLVKRLGMVIDCSIPKGMRKTDQAAQEAVLRDRAREVLETSGKQLIPAAFRLACQLTGFDLRTFNTEMEKLVAFVGNRPQITVEDVKQVMHRSRLDPIYEFTNAVADRNLEAALFYLKTLTVQGIYPLQMLTAIANQVRRLLLAKEFQRTTGNSTWGSGMPYARFAEAVMPAVQQFDRRLTATVEAWNEMTASGDNAAESPAHKPRTHLKKMVTEMILAKNPKSTYPVYQLLNRAGRFSRRHLLEILLKIGQSDRRLKSSAMAAQIILEDLLFFICRKQSSAKRSL